MFGLCAAFVLIDPWVVVSLTRGMLSAGKATDPSSEDSRVRCFFRSARIDAFISSAHIRVILLLKWIKKARGHVGTFFSSCAQSIVLLCSGNFNVLKYPSEAIKFIERSAK